MQAGAEHIANHATRIIGPRRGIHGETKRNGVNCLSPFFRCAAPAFMQNGA